MATFKVRPHGGDTFWFHGFKLADKECPMSDDLKAGIEECERNGVVWAEACIGEVLKPVRGVESGGRLVYRGQDPSWDAVKTWILQIEREESEVLRPFSISCLGMLAVSVLIPALLLVVLYSLGLGSIVESFFQFIWLTLSSLPKAIWVSLTS